MTPRTLTELHADVAGIVKSCDGIIASGAPDEAAWARSVVAIIESLAGQVASLTDERDALAAAMPSEGADAALAYASEKYARERAEAQLAAKDEEIKALRGHAEAMAEEWQELYPNDTPPVSRTSYRAAYPKEPT